MKHWKKCSLVFIRILRLTQIKWVIQKVGILFTIFFFTNQHAVSLWIWDMHFPENEIENFLPISDNLLWISWHDSAWIPMLNPTNVMNYFESTTNPFYDRTCNNEIVKMQRLNMEHLKYPSTFFFCLSLIFLVCKLSIVTWLVWNICFFMSKNPSSM